MKNRYKQAVDTKKHRPLSIQMRQRIREGLFLMSIACAVFLFISLVTYHTSDPGWSSTGLGNKVSNWGGRVGAWIGDIFLSLFGIVATLFPFLIVLASWISVQEREEEPSPREWMFKTLGWFLFVFSSCSLVSFYFHTHSHLPAESGGIVGDLIGSGMSVLFNKAGSTIVFITMLLFGITLVTGLSWFGFVEILGERVSQGWQWLRAKWVLSAANPEKIQKTDKPLKIEKIEPVIDKAKQTMQEEPQLSLRAMPLIINKPAVAKPEPLPREKKKVEVMSGIKLEHGMLPPLSLLNTLPPNTEKAFSHIFFETLSQLVEQRLSDFGVEVKVVAVLPGPVITRFELELAPGIKVSKMTGLAKDIARSLSAVSVRVWK